MNAVNGIGWEVQRFTLGLGWRHFDGPWPTRPEAKAALAAINDSASEYRVYEALQFA